MQGERKALQLLMRILFQAMYNLAISSNDAKNFCEGVTAQKNTHIYLVAISKQGWESNYFDLARIGDNSRNVLANSKERLNHRK
jgi:hypothetical protein